MGSSTSRSRSARRGLVSAGCKFFAALTPGLELDLLCDEPFYTATLGGTVTTLSVDAEGDAPDPLSDVRERNGRMGGTFSRRETTTTSSFFAERTLFFGRRFAFGSKRKNENERRGRRREGRNEGDAFVSFVSFVSFAELLGRRRFSRAAVSRAGRPEHG